jgi:hypothetical protein
MPVSRIQVVKKLLLLLLLLLLERPGLGFLALGEEKRQDSDDSF